MAVLRPELARRTGRPVAFGWAPSGVTGTGAALCQLTGDADEDTPPLPRLAELAAAGARAEAAAHGRPVLRLHLTDRVAGLVTVARAVQDL